MNTKQEALLQKEVEIQAQLTDWVAACSLFSAGDQLKVTIELVSTPTVIVRPTIISRKAWRYENITTELSADEWGLILSCKSLSLIQKVSLEFLKTNNNRPTDGDEIRRHTGTDFNTATINTILSNHQPGFRIRPVGRNAADVNYTFQMFKVRPKR
jgi:hypothetical protein